MKMLLHITSLICTFSLAAQTCLQDQSISGLTQTPKQILTQAGKSATISCVVTSTESITGVHLRKYFSKILYVNSENRISVYNEDKRIVVTGTVGNFNVTINDLKEQDTATYLCDGQTDSERDLCGGGTVLAVAPRIDKRQTEIMQVPKTIVARCGDSVSISCTVTSKKQIRKVWLQNQSAPIVHLRDSKSNEIEQDYRHRLSLHGTFLNFTVTLMNVSAADTGYYLCKGETEDEVDEEEFGSHGTLIVIDANCRKVLSTPSLQSFSVKSQEMFTALLCLVIFLTVTLMLIVACFMSYCRSNQKYQIPRNPLNTVYEEMTLRRDTISSPNCYSNV